MTPPIEDYDDDRELTQYIGWNRSYFLTPFEQLAEEMKIRREKARHLLAEWPDAPPPWAIRVWDECDAPANRAIRDALGDDLESFLRFRDQVRHRIKSAFSRGELLPNRCPDCNRIAETPKAKQCLWCGSDWHGETEE